MTHQYQFFLNLNPNEISSLVNYRFPKLTKSYDHGFINLSQTIKSIIGMIN